MERWLIPVGIVVLLACPLFLVNDYFLRVATLICLYSMMALGWNLLGGYAAQFSLGHAVFFGIGAYTTAFLQINYGVTPWIGLILGAFMAGILAIMIGIPAFQISGHYFSLATLALLQIAHILFTYFSEFTGGSVGLYIPILGHSPGMFQFESTVWYYYIGIFMLVLTLWISRNVFYSKLGYRLRAIKENPVAAQLAGVNLLRAKLTALVFSAIIVSVAGSYYVQFIQYINPDAAFSFDLSIKMALYSIIGGVGVWWGPVLGALILVPLGEYTSLQLTGKLAPLGEVIYGLLLLAIVLLRPRGLAEWLISLWNRGEKKG